MTSAKRSRLNREFERAEKEFRLALGQLRDGLEKSGDESLQELYDKMAEALEKLLTMVFTR